MKRILFISVHLWLLSFAFAVAAQNGDRAGEEQQPLPSEVTRFASPALSPAESLATMQVKPGFRIELIASEPLIGDPVAIDFDAQGRIWVVEMRGYMRTIDGDDEHTPVSRVVILDDTDGDGVMDESTVFLDNLIQPRAILCCYGGALIVEPPNMWFCKDTDGDGAADLMRHLYSGFAGLENPEHAGNGLMHTPDNWIHTSQHGTRFRFDGERIEIQQIPGHGQWGISKDDWGRVFVNTNSDPLRGDLFPAHYGARHPHAGRLSGVNERFMRDLAVFPMHPTPGINRGYQQAMLREDYTLTTFTAACGPCIYRGDLFPPEFRGNAFICEPTGNLIKRAILREENNTIVAEHAYDDTEFLAADDERFRPVNCSNGPDGGLYVVDMYRGIVQHRIYMTSFLRAQVEARGLDKPIGLGRVYRIVPEEAGPYVKPNLAAASNAELVEHLAHANGWVRDTAQRLLVERRAADVQEVVRTVARAHDSARARMHAYWTLDGIGTVTFDDAVAAVADQHPQIQRIGVRLLERWMDEPRAHDVIRGIVASSADDNLIVQCALSLGEGQSNLILRELAHILTHHTGSGRVRSAVASGLAGRDLAFLEHLVTEDEWMQETGPRKTFVKSLIETMLRSRDVSTAQGLFDSLAAVHAHRPWLSRVMLDTINSHQKLETNSPRFVVVESEPAGWGPFVEAMRDHDDAAFAAIIARIDAHLYWPNRPGMTGPGGPRALTTEEVVRFEQGRRLYRTLCMSCHQPNGSGQAGTAPALANNDDVNADNAGRVIRILLHGLSGPIEVNGESFNASMPKSPAPGDAEIAALLTYIRRAWGNTGDPVTAADVAHTREQTRGRREPWTVFELEQIKGED